MCLLLVLTRVRNIYDLISAQPAEKICKHVSKQTAFEKVPNSQKETTLPSPSFFIPFTCPHQ